MAIPKLEFAVLVRLFGAMSWPKVEAYVGENLGGSPLVIPSNFRDLQNEEMRPLIDGYYRGSTSSAQERIKLFKLLWAALGNEFGARHTLYERNPGGSPQLVRLNILQFGKDRGRLDEMQSFVEACMSVYGLDGWSDGPWV